MSNTHLTPDAHPRPHHEPFKLRGMTSQDLGPQDQTHTPQPSVMASIAGPSRTHRKLVLCFDGTGNKFKGDDSDSNILKIFRCLDRTAGDQYHYYQPGIGTYVISNSLSHTGIKARLKSWYLKAKDSAVGTSFDHHVVGGYRFMMRFYNPGDELYIFGFSRGAYVARFLAEMLDFVGLLSHGNEEMVTFAWKAFSQWQSRQSEATEVDREKRREMYRYMKGFRETFSRPVKRIRFLGLFDTVNSVPRFEAAWMQRSKFPYTARTSAKVIRHCVSIDERRAKFRQDLMYQGSSRGQGGGGSKEKSADSTHDRYRAKHKGHRHLLRQDTAHGHEPTRGRTQNLAPPERNETAFRPHSRSASRTTTHLRKSSDGLSLVSVMADEDSDSDEEQQDVDEIWFAGGHGDVGGGWEITEDSKSASHVPLVYMIREAQRAGLVFDREKLIELGVSEDLDSAADCGRQQTEVDDQQIADTVPDIRIDVSSPTPTTASQFRFETSTEPREKGEDEDEENCTNENPFHKMLHKAHLARIHDSLEFSSGLGKGQVMSWKIMEYMPFRRMDLCEDGSWKPIRWPLPCGEVRDIPHGARIHGSVLRRLREDPTYRPGNLIIGGGGRGVRWASEEHGIGDWECVQDSGCPIGEVWEKKRVSQDSSE